MNDYNDDIGPNHTGRRLREIRVWRQQTLATTADLAGITFGYLAKLERGEKPLGNRATLEALARALRVPPSAFAPAPWQSADGTGGGAHTGLLAVEDALDAYEWGDDPGVSVRDWPL
ncbi:helix-turn-helix domain-containing protein, partial [Actinoplanes sp. GCM10030250]|uniref:helix-turn-helix domain-containing protein n=1 Tax=Actinoplanes sp. GCM10030250 TaxID=3273376 RepID=UPI00360A3D48